MKALPRRIELSLLLVLLLMAVALRVLGLLHAPPGFSARELTDLRITDQVRAGQVTVFYEVGDAEGAREGLYHVLLAVFTALVGDGLYGYRALSVLFGMLALGFTFALARELFGGRVALFTLAAMSVSFWPVFIARMVGREAVMPCFTAAGMYFVARGILAAHRRPDDQLAYFQMAGGGLLLGLALYVHWSGVALLVAFLLYGLYLRAVSPHTAYRHMDIIGFTLLITAIVAIPFIVSVLRTPGISALSYYSSKVLGALPGAPLDTVAGLFFAGDPNPTHNLPGRPLLDPFSALFFLVGLGVALRRRRQPFYGVVPVLLVMTLLPDAISSPGADFTVMAVAMPVLYLAVGIGADRVFTWAARRRAALAGVVVIVLVLVGVVMTTHDLHQVWSYDEQVYQAYHGNLGHLAPYFEATARRIPTTVCSPSLNVNDPELLSDRAILNYMMHQPDLPLRYADCRTSLVLSMGGAAQHIAFTYPDGPSLLPPGLGRWFRAAEPVPVPGLAEDKIFDVMVQEALSDQLGRFITTAPAGFAPEVRSGPVKLPVRFGGNVTFVGYEFGPDVYNPGDVMQLITYWRVDGVVPAGLTMFAHLLSDPASTTPVAQHDYFGPIVDTLQPGDIFIQQSLLYLPSNLLPDDYELSIGLYTRPEGRRLMVFDEDQQPRGDHLFLRRVNVLEPEEESSGE